jgi:hypothetical protein
MFGEGSGENGRSCYKPLLYKQISSRFLFDQNINFAAVFIQEIADQ